MPSETNRLLLEVPPGQPPVTVIEFATNETESGFIYQVRQGGRTVGTTENLQKAEDLAKALIEAPAEPGAPVPGVAAPLPGWPEGTPA